MVNYNKLIIKRRLPIMISDNIGGQSIDNLIQQLEEIKLDYKNQFTNIKIETDTFDGSIEIFFYGEEFENDEQYDARIKMEEEYEKDRLDKRKKLERKEFERMKKEHGW